MSLSLQADPLPLRADEHGSIRIGNTRVLLELVIRGSADEEWCDQVVYVPM